MLAEAVGVLAGVDAAVRVGVEDADGTTVEVRDGVGLGEVELVPDGVAERLAEEGDADKDDDGIGVARTVDVVEAVPLTVGVGRRTGGNATPLNWYIGDVTASNVQVPELPSDESNLYSELPTAEFHVVTYSAYATASSRHAIA